MIRDVTMRQWSVPFHVQVSGRGLSMRSGALYNLDEAAVQEQVVRPWGEGRPIVASGSVFDPFDSKVTVREGPELDSTALGSISPWMILLDASTDVTNRFIVVAPGSLSQQTEHSITPDPRRVGVIHGRDAAAVAALFDYLRALDLHPLEWNELVRATGTGAPSNRSVVEQLFTLATAVVVLLTPDDEVRLHPALVPSNDRQGEGAWACQPRPNVLLEAGMAIAHRPDRTVFVDVGNIVLPSDIDGVNRVRLDGTAGPLHALATRLGDAGCAVDLNSGSSWLDVARWVDLGARTRLPAAGASDDSSSPIDRE